MSKPLLALSALSADTVTDMQGTLPLHAPALPVGAKRSYWPASARHLATMAHAKELAQTARQETFGFVTAGISEDQRRYWPTRYW